MADELEKEALKESFLFAQKPNLHIPDFLIKVDSYAFKVHSSLFAAKSSFFAQICGNNWEEGHDQEVTLHDEDPSPVAMMGFQGFQDLKIANWRSMARIMRDARLLHGGPPLSEDEESVLEARVENGWPVAITELLCLAYKYGIKSLVKDCMRNIQSYDAASETLWIVQAVLMAAGLEAMQYIRVFLTELARDAAEDMADDLLFLPWLDENPDIASAVLQRSIKERGTAEKEISELKRKVEEFESNEQDLAKMKKRVRGLESKERKSNKRPKKG